MDQNDISDIIPIPEEEFSHFADVAHRSQKQSVYQSLTFPRLFYAIKSMIKLLDERNELCLSLGLSSRKGGGIPLNQIQLAKYFSVLFNDGPEELDDYSWAIVEDKGTIYGFLASQQKYVPLCKQCNYAVYVTLRGSQGRVVCGNPKCKVKLLGQFEYEGKEGSRMSKDRNVKSGSKAQQSRKVNKYSNINQKLNISNQISQRSEKQEKSQHQQSHKQQLQFKLANNAQTHKQSQNQGVNLQDKQLIKRAARRILQ